jgi:hypothetical protein
MVSRAGACGTCPSEIGLDYASQVKPGKATWQRGFRLKDGEYRANTVYDFKAEMISKQGAYVSNAFQQIL